MKGKDKDKDDDKDKEKAELQCFPWWQAGAERKVSFDWGPDGSKAEDCFFGIVALDQVLDISVF